MNNHGICGCGCEGETSIANRTRPERGCVKGEPNKFISGHNPRRIRRKEGDGQGYLRVPAPNHPRASWGRTMKHIIIIEKALGKPIPINAVTHHIDEDKSNNRNTNLVLCNDLAYHNLLHRRIRALRACGYAAGLLCKYCHKYDKPEHLFVGPNGTNICHKVCRAQYLKTRYNKIKRGIL